jgi:hypothetical protein
MLGLNDDSKIYEPISEIIDFGPVRAKQNYKHRGLKAPPVRLFDPDHFLQKAQQDTSDANYAESRAIGFSGENLTTEISF